MAAGAVGGVLVLFAVLARRGSLWPRLFLGSAAPISGNLRAGVPWAGLVLPAAVAAAVVALGPDVAARLGRVALPVVTALTAAGWAFALALVDGGSALGAPLASPDDYLAEVHRVRDPLSLLAGFTDLVVQRPGVAAWSTHVSGHPPGALLLFWGLDRVGLGTPSSVAIVLVLAGSSAAAAVVVAVRALAGPSAAAAAAPLLALAPYALWVATSADAAFLAASAWGLALLAVAVARPDSRAGAAAAVAGGVLLGGGLYLSYGLVPLGVVAVAVLLGRGPTAAVRPALLAGLGVLAVVAVYTAAGFWWPDGLLATHARWAQGEGSRRPFGYTVVANLAVAAVAAGPAAVAGLPQLRRLPRALTGTVAAALLSLLLADASGLSRGEVERIWLPFLPWLLAGAIALGNGRAVPRVWLVVQAGCALAVTAVVRTTW